MAEKILFLTGKLAERQLKRILKAMKPDFSYKINQIGVSVAALMSENIIMRRVKVDETFNKIIIPGKFRGDLKKLSNYFQIPVERGPEDLTSLPDYFGMDNNETQLNESDCLIFAEIVDATTLTVNEILTRAEEYRNDGADVIDIGCMPDTEFSNLEEVIYKLKKSGHKVSIDSANYKELLRGGKCGADYLLSISEKNYDILDSVDSIPVLIPSQPGDLKSLERIIRKTQSMNRDFLADPILDPIHYGFVDSIVRYKKLRSMFPDIKILMGIGNLTELTDCDSVGVNTVLMGLVSELSVSAVLVVQVSNHCKNSIKETDQARKLMYFAKKNQRLPVGIDESLMCLSNRRLLRQTKDEIDHFKLNVKDRNYRIMLTDKKINIFNKDVHLKGTDPYDFYNKLDVDNDSSHSFYLGVELARAQIALQLYKNYNQDNELNWGTSLKKDKVDLLKRPKLKSTQEKKNDN